ncbi:MAG: DUF2244 domain-containing protein [Alphaproteobacteria bacterium]
MTVKPEDAGDGPFYFDAVLYPNRSLSQSGFLIVMGIMAGMSLIVGTFFLVIGAWPVFGFYGLDVLLVYLAFRWNYRQGRLREIIRLSDDALEIIRILPGGRRQRFAFEPYWVRIELDDPPDHDSHIHVRSHGRETVIGAFLTPEERTDLVNALRQALRDQARGVLPEGGENRSDMP